jgi:integrase
MGNQPRTRDRVFSVAEKRAGTYQVSWLSSGQSVPPRKQFKAESVEEAVELAEKEWYGDCTFVSLRGPEIHQVFEEWLDSMEGRVAAATIEGDYEPRSNLFLAWVDKEGFVLWTELFPKDITRYAQEGAETRKRSVIKKRCRIIGMANEYVLENYPDFHRPLPYKVPRGKQADEDRDTLSIAQGIEFLLQVREMPHGWNTLPGFAIGILTGDRIQGFRDILWMHVDWTRRTISLRNKPNIGLPPRRVIPLPALLEDILREAYDRIRPSENDPILVTSDKHSYKQAFNRYRDRFLPGVNLEPNGLRRSLFQASLFNGFYGISFEHYIGHKPPQIPEVTWKHYLQRLQLNLDEVLEMLRRDVVKPWDEILEPYRKRWNRPAVDSNVIQLHVGT